MYLKWSFELWRSVPITFFIRSGGVPRTAGHLDCSAYRHPARPQPTPSIEIGYRCVPCIAMTVPIQGTPQYPSWDPDHFFDGIYSTWCMTRFLDIPKPNLVICPGPRTVLNRDHACTFGLVSKSGHMSKSHHLYNGHTDWNLDWPFFQNLTGTGFGPYNFAPKLHIDIPVLSSRSKWTKMQQHLYDIYIYIYIYMSNTTAPQVRVWTLYWAAMQSN